MPMRSMPGFSTSSRTFAVRMAGSSDGPMFADAPLEDKVGIGMQMHVGEFAQLARAPDRFRKRRR